MLTVQSIFTISWFIAITYSFEINSYFPCCILICAIRSVSCDGGILKLFILKSMRPIDSSGSIKPSDITFKVSSSPFQAVYFRNKLLQMLLFFWHSILFYGRLNFGVVCYHCFLDLVFLSLMFLSRHF